MNSYILGYYIIFVSWCFYCIQIFRIEKGPMSGWNQPSTPMIYQYPNFPWKTPVLINKLILLEQIPFPNDGLCSLLPWGFIVTGFVVAVTETDFDYINFMKWFLPVWSMKHEDILQGWKEAILQICGQHFFILFENFDSMLISTEIMCML